MFTRGRRSQPPAKLHILHSTLYTPHFRLYMSHFTLTLRPLHFTLHTPHSKLHTPHSTLCTLHSTHYTVCSTLYTPESHFTPTRYIPHSTLHCLHSPHSALHPVPHTLRSLHHWYDNRGRMYNTVGITCFMKIFYVAASLCVSASVPLPYVCAFGFVGRILFQLNFKKHRFIGCWRRAACLHFEHASRMCHMACRVCKDFNLIFFAGGLAIL